MSRCVYVCVCLAFTCTYVNMSMSYSTHTCVRVYTYTHTDVIVCEYVCVTVHTYVCVNTYTHIYKCHGVCANVLCHVKYMDMQIRMFPSHVLAFYCRCHQPSLPSLPHTATHCNTIQYTETHCNTLCATWCFTVAAINLRCLAS